jgi:predicted nucleic acid-binding protein
LIYLLDTNVVSELRKPRPHGAVAAWKRTVAAHQLAIPAVVLAEAQTGVERTRKQDPAKALELEIWIDNLAAYYEVVPADGQIFREWARLMHKRSLDLTADALIAATAKLTGMTVATRNVKDFVSFGAQVFNPFTYKEIS